MKVFKPVRNLVFPNNRSNDENDISRVFTDLGYSTNGNQFVLIKSWVKVGKRRTYHKQNCNGWIFQNILLDTGLNTVLRMF